MDKMQFKGEASGACPNYFRYGVMEARFGGNGGYEVPGWHLAIHVGQYVDGDAMEELSTLTEDEDIIRWFRHYLPRAMVLVPRRREGTFLKGICQAIEEGRVY